MTGLCFGYVINCLLVFETKDNLFCFFILYNEPTNAQLNDKLLYCSYMFRHYCVILKELVVSTLLSYTIMSMQSLRMTQ